MKWLGLVALVGALAGPAQAAELLPGYDVLRQVTLRAGGRTFVVAALARNDEPTTRPAPARPLLILLRRTGGRLVPVGRNDAVVLRADQGGQCDPFADGGRVIAVEGARFTVQNGVACGAGHWTDHIAFRFDHARGGFVFAGERRDSWSLNPSRDPGAEALVRDGPPRLDRAGPRPVRFENWRPTR